MYTEELTPKNVKEKCERQADKSHILSCTQFTPTLIMDRYTQAGKADSHLCFLYST